MTPSTFTLSPCLPKDTDSATAVIIENWHYDATFPFQFPECGSDPSTVSDFTSFNLRLRLGDKGMESVKAEVDGKFAGFCIWEYPEGFGGGNGGGGDNGGGGEGPLAGKKPIPPKGSEKFREQCTYAAGRQFAAKMKGMKYIEIQNINLHKEYQRHGIASEMMKRCFEKADELALPIMAMSVPYSRDFYVKMGFEEEDSFGFDLKDWAGREDVGRGVYKYYWMLRPAVKK